MASRDDGFKLDDNYRVEEEYTRSTNRKGFGETLHVKVPPEIAGEIAAIVASRKIGALRTTQDFVRSAIVHRLHWMAGELDDGQTHRIVQAEIAMCRTERYLEEMKSLENNLSKFKEAAEVACQNNDFAMLVGLVMEARETARHIRDPYATRLEDNANLYAARLPAEWRGQLDVEGAYDATAWAE